MKILVTGNSGAGKSTLGKKLSEKYAISLHGLDKIVWSKGWVKTTKAKKEFLIGEILKQNDWVIEGVTKSGMLEADIIYFLDIHPLRCSFNTLKRFLKNGLGTRDDLPKGCPEYIGVLISLRIIWSFNKTSKLWIVDKKFRSAKAKFIHIESYKQLEKYTGSYL